jgi:hypothetical protein
MYLEEIDRKIKPYTRFDTISQMSSIALLMHCSADGRADDVFLDTEEGP